MSNTPISLAAADAFCSIVDGRVMRSTSVAGALGGLENVSVAASDTPITGQLRTPLQELAQAADSEKGAAFERV
jgi:hypothetical protein